MSKSPIAWLKDVADHDYEAAYNYLSLKFDAKRAGELIAGRDAAVGPGCNESGPAAAP